MTKNEKETARLILAKVYCKNICKQDCFRCTATTRNHDNMNRWVERNITEHERTEKACAGI